MGYRDNSAPKRVKVYDAFGQEHEVSKERAEHLIKRGTHSKDANNLPEHQPLMTSAKGDANRLDADATSSLLRELVDAIKGDGAKGPAAPVK